MVTSSDGRTQAIVLLAVASSVPRRWAGLWDFPRFAVVAEQTANVRDSLRDEMKRTLGIEVTIGESLQTLKHGVTRFKITLDAYDVELTSGKLKPTTPFAEARWVSPKELGEYPLNTTGRKLTKLLDARQQRLGFGE